MRTHLGHGRLLATALVVAAATACDSPSDTGLEPQLTLTGWERTSFDVFSQNVYLGGSTGPLFDPDVLADPGRVLVEVNTFWTAVQQSDVAARMDAIAEEIALRGPEVVGLQEVLQFVTLDGSFQPDGGGLVDFLGALGQAIEDRGLPYDVAFVQPTTSSALPLQADPSTGAVTQYLGFTDRLVILKRSDVVVTDSDGGTYGALIPVAPQVDIKRGWARLTIDHEGTTHHFVNTHLETQRAYPIQELQAIELMGLLDGLDGVTVLVGDLNSDAEGGPGDPSWTPTYDALVTDGFSDLWEISPHSLTDPGFTCCQDDDLRNHVSVLDERIDFVLVRSSEGPIPGQGARRGHFRADVVGDRSSDRTATGLWPSDHAGLVGSIRTEDPRAED